MSEEQKQKIVRYLNEAYGLELALVRQLQAHIPMTPRSSFRDGLEDHLEETRGHALRLERRLDELGQGNDPLHVGLGNFQSVMGQAMALTKTPLDLVRGSGGEEKVLKNAMDLCTAEAQEIATYTALARLARTVGDDRTLRLVTSVLRDEQRMLDRLLKAIPRLTDAVARAEIDGDDAQEVTRRAGPAGASHLVGGTGGPGLRAGLRDDLREAIENFDQVRGH